MDRDELERAVKIKPRENCEGCRFPFDIAKLLSSLDKCEERVKQAEAQLQSYKDENEQLRQNYNNLADEFNRQNSHLNRVYEAVEKCCAEADIDYTRAIIKLYKTVEEIKGKNEI